MGNLFQSLGDSALANFIPLGDYAVAGAAVNAFRFLMSSGNIASGTIRVYGIAKV